MDKELQVYLEGMEQRLTTAIDHTQEVLAQVVKRGFDDTEGQFREMRKILGAIAEAVDANVPGWEAGSREAGLITRYREDLDGLATRVKELEEEIANRR